MKSKRLRTSLTTAAAVLGVGLGSYGIASATSSSGIDGQEDQNESPDTPIAERDIGRASDAALAHTGEGTVSATEVGDEESYYEVEVTLADGSEVDVQLDENFNVVGDEVEGADEGDEADGDEVEDEDEGNDDGEGAGDDE